MLYYEVLALAFLTFHGPTGARIDVNGEAISSIRDPSAMPQGHWDSKVHCVILVDGSAPIAVMETCDEVRQKILKPTGPCMLVCGETQKR